MFRTIKFNVFYGIFTVCSYPHAPGMPPEGAVFHLAPDPKCTLKDSPHMRQQLLSAESPPRVDSVVWVLICVVAVAFIEEDSDEEAEDDDCDDEEEADDKMGVLSMDDEAGVEEAEDDAGIEGPIVGTYKYVHV